MAVVHKPMEPLSFDDASLGSSVSALLLPLLFFAKDDSTFPAAEQQDCIISTKP